MPREQWPLRHGRPCVEILLTPTLTGPPLARTLLADTGAGSQQARIELILEEKDCLTCGGIRLQTITLSGACAGTYPIYGLRIRLPALGFDRNLQVAGVVSSQAGFDGIACFGFLNRFTYGNFGDPNQFGLEG
jgi:hypothetical protein